MTIVLQRTGDPANLNRLRPHLELLANIDPNPGMWEHAQLLIFFSTFEVNNTRELLLTFFPSQPLCPWWLILDAVSPTWEQLENAMVAVKTVVHGLVDFIQNYSRKGHETPQVSIFITFLTAIISNPVSS